MPLHTHTYTHKHTHLYTLTHTHFGLILPGSEVKVRLHFKNHCPTPSLLTCTLVLHTYTLMNTGHTTNPNTPHRVFPSINKRGPSITGPQRALCALGLVQSSSPSSSSTLGDGQRRSSQTSTRRGVIIIVIPLSVCVCVCVCEREILEDVRKEKWPTVRCLFFSSPPLLTSLRIDFPSVRVEPSNRPSVKASVCVTCYRPDNGDAETELM